MQGFNNFNKWLALKITNGVGSMWCAYFFVLLSALDLPATLVLMGLWPHGWLPSWMQGQSFIWMITWICQNFLQLVLLSVIMVGQNTLAESSEHKMDEILSKIEKQQMEELNELRDDKKMLQEETQILKEEIAILKKIDRK